MIRRHGCGLLGATPQLSIHIPASVLASTPIQVRGLRRRWSLAMLPVRSEQQLQQVLTDCSSQGPWIGFPGMP